MSEKSSLLHFVFSPLFVKGRWVIWGLGALIFLMLFGNTITAIRMEIPSSAQVIKVRGTFIDTSKGHSSKTGLYSIGIIDDQGVFHKCSCEPLAHSNCLGRRESDHREVKHLLNPEILEKYGTHKAMLKWLDGKQGELWMYPNRSLLGGQFSCYQIASEVNIHRSYERSVEEYSRAKNGIDVYLLWLVTFLGSIVIAIYIAVRIRAYLKEEKSNG